MQGRVPVGTYDAQTVLANDLCLPRADQEADIPSSFMQAAAKITTDGASADHQNSHVYIICEFRKTNSQIVLDIRGGVDGTIPGLFVIRDRVHPVIKAICVLVHSLHRPPKPRRVIAAPVFTKHQECNLHTIGQGLEMRPSFPDCRLLQFRSLGVTSLQFGQFLSRKD